MKNNNRKHKKKAIAELAVQFEEDFKKVLPLSIQPDGSIVYKTYYIKQVANGNWGLYNLHSRDLLDEYYLKTCAIMAAKAHSSVFLERVFEIKRLDSRYWANQCDSIVYKKNIKKAKELDRFIIMLNRLEYSEEQAKHYQDEISLMFKRTFV